jgi:hypothetical protein
MCVYFRSGTQKPISWTNRIPGFESLNVQRKLAVLFKDVCSPKRYEVTGEWRRLHNEELKDLYSSPNIIRVIKSRRKRWAGHVALWGSGDTGFW